MPLSAEAGDEYYEGEEKDDGGEYQQGHIRLPFISDAAARQAHNHAYHAGKAGVGNKGRRWGWFDAERHAKNKI